MKLGFLAVGVISLSYLPFVIVGLCNRIFGGWRSVFFCYAGNRAYIDRYAFGWSVAPFRWRPVPIGVLRQGRGLGLVLAAPMTESDFLDPANARNVERFRRRLGRIARIVGVDQVHLAGILPGVLRGDGVFRPFDTRDSVAACVVAAAARLVDERFGGAWPPVILLGGAGHVGTVLAARMTAEVRDVHVVDPQGGTDRLPDLDGAPALLIDLSRRGVIDGYVDRLWPGLVVLNETFPEPSRATQAAIAARGVDLYHLSGVWGRIVPPLPFGYAGAVPCCARHDTAGAPEVVVVKLAEAAPVASETRAVA